MRADVSEHSSCVQRHSWTWLLCCLFGEKAKLTLPSSFTAYSSVRAKQSSSLCVVQGAQL